MGECQECGGHVTDDFARVFGNNENDVYGCLNCMNQTAVKNGGARSKDADGDNHSLGGVRL